MKYLLILFGTLVSFSVFSQSSSTVTLLFVTPSNESYKNLEAVIDEVSYYSENISAPNNKNQSSSMRNRNTIWLYNFEPGKHSIQVYNLKNGSGEIRIDNTPLYATTFVVKKGFDTKIAVKHNGQVQLSERLSAGSNESNTRSKATNNQNNDDSFNKENTSGNVSHSSRIDTAILVNNIDNGSFNSSKNNGEKLNDQNDNNNKAPMDGSSFNQLYETIRNQWHPGQKMKSITDMFLNSGENFTTGQAKQLIKLVTEEGNRLKLAKSSYHCITDPENFNEMNEVLRYKTSREALSNFVKEVQG